MKIQLTEEQHNKLLERIVELCNMSPYTFITNKGVGIVLQALNEILDDGTPIYTGTIKREEE